MNEAEQLEQAVRNAVNGKGFGIEGFRPLVFPHVPGEPTILVSPTGRHYVIETTIIDITGWESER